MNNLTFVSLEGGKKPQTKRERQTHTRERREIYIYIDIIINTFTYFLPFLENKVCFWGAKFPFQASNIV